MMLKVDCHPHQFIADDNNLCSTPNIPYLKHKVYLLINGACHIWQGNISVIRHFQIPLFFRRATPPAVFVTEP